MRYALLATLLLTLPVLAPAQPLHELLARIEQHKLPRAAADRPQGAGAGRPD